MQRVVIITTGGTIEKTYDETSGELENRRSVVRRMLRRLRLVDLDTSVVELMSKDSRDMTDHDRDRILNMVGGFVNGSDRDDLRGVVVLHGTDTLEKTGTHLHEQLTDLHVPVVLTGAMRPFEMRTSDALQNLTEAIFATSMLQAGVYCAAHGRVLRFPGVRKDHKSGTFVC